MPAKSTERAAKAAMSDDHKAALAKGRSEGRIVRHYLDGLRALAPRRGRRRTSDTIQRRLGVIAEELTTADSMRQLKLVQERRDLQAELDSIEEPADIAGLEAAFIDVAKPYSDRQGISYQSWREVGVSAAVLAKAGIARSR
jgi:hypothetical protein